MAKIYIYSTLTSDQIYTNYRRAPSGVPIAEAKILIKGGANLMTKALITPFGAVTEVTDNDLAELRKNEVFRLHLQNGFITISEAKADVESVAADMTGRDQSAPLVGQDEIIPVPATAEESSSRRRNRKG